eukprot:4657115-Alexandrium_andersonii.AAC.1
MDHQCKDCQVMQSITMFRMYGKSGAEEKGGASDTQLKGAKTTGGDIGHEEDNHLPGNHASPMQRPEGQATEDLRKGEARKGHKGAW